MIASGKCDRLALNQPDDHVELPVDYGLIVLYSLDSRFELLYVLPAFGNLVQEIGEVDVPVDSQAIA